MENFINRSVLSKGWKCFLIMHKDRVVARIYEDGHATIKFSSFMPYNLYLEEGNDIDIRTNNLTNFYYWCSSRVLMLDRKYAKEILNSIGATQSRTDKERATIALSYHCLNLLDVFWVKSKNEKIKFDDICLYNHHLADTFVDVSLRGKPLTLEDTELYNLDDQAANLGTPGVAPKAWIRRNDTFYLLKDGNERDVYAELLASKIVSCFNVKSVIYEESTFNDQLVSKSHIITSLKKSITAIEYVDVYCANHDLDRTKYILKKDKYNFYMMNIIDYLIGNIDRHWGNWGFYVDNNTNKILELYPLMDFNKSFLAYDSINGTTCQTYEKIISQKDAAIIAVKAIGLNQIKELDESWFTDNEIKSMFFERLRLLKNYDK